MRATLGTLAVLVLFAGLAQSVDRGNFKTCEQSSFCRRCRKVQPDNSPFQVVPASLNTYSDSVTVDLVNTENNHLFVLKVAALKDNTFHVVVDEKTPLKPRYRVQEALKGPLQPDTVKVTEKSDDQVVLTSGPNKAVLNAKPFRLDFYQDNVLTVSANAKGLMRFEHLRAKTRAVLDEEGNEIVPPETGGQQQPKSIEDEDPGAWEENFKSHHDSKPNGPEAIALDFSFPQARILFGIPEHADSFALKSTVGGEPYRLYNLDVFEYELDNGMALYGSIPVIYGHGAERTAGVYWQNAAETWVDIYNPETEGNVLSSIVNLVSGSNADKHPLTANFMSESGVMEAFILMGPRPHDVFKQYTDLTGVAPLPQLFALGYHQCRWNYNDQLDVDTVSNNFDVHDIPMDTMWLDIEYTDGKKYFTWDQHKFPNSVEMIQNLTHLGRHLTVIIDPHIKRDNNYFFHNDCQDKGYYTKNKDGLDYEGWCWPGAASYPDLFNPEVRQYFAEQYSKFPGTTNDVMIWNDMNEPSVFNGPEVTMLKDNQHFGGWEHRDVHNLYGHMQLMSTYEGLRGRDDGKQRPFILSRAHFAGSQRYATIWTGDNTADWGHLQASIKMCLSESVSGMSFCGADIGGFFGNPDAELLERWYQTAAFQPFFRAHAHIDTKRREPWLFPEATKLVIRDAVRKRYSFLPLWYTLFYEHERFGQPVMRPLLSAYPTDVNAFALDDQFMVGDVLLVHPVMEQGVNSVNVYFPINAQNTADLWYDIDDHRRIDTAGHQTVSVNSYKIPVYQRGGTILSKKERVRRASTLMINDPYTIYVALDRQGKAHGTLYMDDEKSFEYRNGKYVYLKLDFADDTLRAERVDESSEYPVKSWVERVVLLGLDRVPTSATLKSSNGNTVQLDVAVEQNGAIAIRKPGVSMLEKWTITLEY